MKKIVIYFGSSEQSVIKVTELETFAKEMRPLLMC